ncbi:MAG: hypothetical protein SCARUB_01641 [Candidatus Scalindua rubra]|uniref:PIN domain-containing protein n=1 Tax=Candidatus Scalindua rubra TaxID=1872076 RepID=A0A1E3XCC4_9BACT|nr:MAG: hypothetical protein SCARUB_01641 [Candidatus Scalindua rubra]
MRTKNNPKVIVDTYIWIEFFRTKSKISNHLRDLISNDFVVGNGLILAELIQGIKTNSDKEVIIDVFNTIEYIEITRELWIESGDLARELRSSGKIIPLSDVIIACCARKYQYHIFTIDKHFQDIPNIKIINF